MYIIIHRSKPKRLLYKDTTILSICLLAFLTCCSSMSEGTNTYPFLFKLPVTTICLSNVHPSPSKIDEGFINDNSFSSFKPSRNGDDDFIAKIASSHIEIDLIRKGYVILHQPCGQHDINLYIATFYQQNNWPFDNRTFQIEAQISNISDVPLFYVNHISVNPYGPLGDYLGYSTDEMLSDVSEQTTNHIIKMLAGKN